MSAPQNFRSAFNGFNREDVVRYLEYLNSRHTSQVNQLTSEAEYLRNKLDVAQNDPEVVQERDALRFAADRPYRFENMTSSTGRLLLVYQYLK